MKKLLNISAALDMPHIRVGHYLVFGPLAEGTTFKFSDHEVYGEGDSVYLDDLVSLQDHDEALAIMTEQVRFCHDRLASMRHAERRGELVDMTIVSAIRGFIQHKEAGMEFVRSRRHVLVRKERDARGKLEEQVTRLEDQLRSAKDYIRTLEAQQ